jgi:hypothetical protein
MPREADAIVAAAATADAAEGLAAFVEKLPPNYNRDQR